MTEAYLRCGNKLEEFMQKQENLEKGIEISEFEGNKDFIIVHFSDGSTKFLKRTEFPECDELFKL